MPRYKHIKDFKPFLKNIQKYVNGKKGINEKLVSRSSLEASWFLNFDSDEKVTSWSSENLIISYNKPIFEITQDGLFFKHYEVRNYYVDVVFKYNNGITFIGEIKPLSFCFPPKPPKQNRKKSILNYYNALQDFYVNKAKWIAVLNKINNKKNFKFVLLTESKILNFDEKMLEIYKKLEAVYEFKNNPSKKQRKSSEKL